MPKTSNILDYTNCRSTKVPGRYKSTRIEIRKGHLYINEHRMSGALVAIYDALVTEVAKGNNPFSKKELGPGAKRRYNELREVYKFPTSGYDPKCGDQ